MDTNNEIIFDDGRKKISFIIDGVEYKALTSAGNLLIPNDDIYSEYDYRTFISSQLLSDIISENKPKLEDITKQNDKFFINIFDNFLYRNTEFYSFFNEIECEDICMKYVSAYMRYCTDKVPHSLQNVKTNLTNTIQMFSDSVIKITQNIDLSFINQLNEIIRPALSCYSEHIKVISSVLQETCKKFTTLSQSFFSTISDIIKDIDISEERKNELLQSYEQWGKYGWTIPPYA